MGLAGDGDGASEGLRGLVCGVVFGATSPLVGHPIDSVKTTMMARAGYLRGSALATAAGLVRTEGVLALYRGLLPPLAGSAVFRSVQFSTYAAAYGACRDVPQLCEPIPALAGVQPRVLLAALVSSTARSLIETPLEYVKIRRQLNEPWVASPVRAYAGFGLAWARMVVALGGYFVLMDVTERRYGATFAASPVAGAFVQGSLCATAAWAAAWPLELLRTTAQAGVAPGATALQRTALVLRERGGLRGLYRGIGPGLLRSLVANGAATLAYTICRSCWPAAA